MPSMWDDYPKVMTNTRGGGWWLRPGFRQELLSMANELFQFRQEEARRRQQESCCGKEMLDVQMDYPSAAKATRTKGQIRIEAGLLTEIPAMLLEIMQLRHEVEKKR